MEIILYTTKDEDRIINKTLEHKYTIEIDFKDSTNLMNPMISLFEEESVDLQSVNYAYIPEFKRYYFIRNVNVTSGGIYYILLECDVLETYKEEILESKAEITRSIKDNDYRTIAPSSEVRKEVDIYEYSKGFTGDSSIILTTVGKGGY